MSELAEPFALPLRASHVEPVAGAGPRAAAFAAAVVLLLAGALISLGAVLLVPPATWIASRVAGRARPLGFGARWIVALATMLVVLGGVAVISYMAGAVPPGTITRMQQAADSSARASHKQPAPKWLERIAPGASQRAAQRPMLPSGVMQGVAVWALGISTLLMACLYATFGWGGGLLLRYGVRGRWPGYRAPELRMGME